MRIAAYIFAIFGNFGSLAGGVVVLVQALTFLNRTSASSVTAYFMLGAGGLATFGALAGAVGVIWMSWQPRSRMGPILLLTAAIAATLALPATLLGFSVTFTEFLFFPLSPAVFLSAAATFALLGRRADPLDSLTAWEEPKSPR